MKRNSEISDIDDSHVNKTVDDLESIRGESLDRFIYIQQLHQSMYELELKRLESKYGPNHARSQNLAGALEMNGAVQNALELQKAFMNSNSEEFEAGTWRVQGHVCSSDYSPLAGVRVSLAVDKELQQRDMRPSVTDNLGFYSITLDKKAVEQLKGKPVRVIVAGKYRGVVRADDSMLTPALDIIDIQNIVISDEKPDVATPKAARRKRG
jgi:hypothetical protein